MGRQALLVESMVDAGYNRTCALAPDGPVRCWGDNTIGQAPPSLPGPFAQCGVIHRAFYPATYAEITEKQSTVGLLTVTSSKETDREQPG